MRFPSKRKLDKLSQVHDLGYAAAEAGMTCDAPDTMRGSERTVWATGWRAYHRHNGTGVATREEQHGRYLDCGPGAWDDRDNND